jgi:hypothetical protein
LADLTYIQQAQEVKITGQDTVGTTVNYVGADVNGNMKVIDFATSPTASAVPADASYIAGKNPSGNLQGIATDTSGRQYIDLFDGAGNAITSSSDGVAGFQLLHVQTPDTTTASTVLGALNATVSITMAGLSSVGFQILAGTLIGTLVPECSIDGGTTWVQASFYDPANSTVSTSLVFGSSNTTKVLSVLPIGGSSNVRVRVSLYTSGTANSILRASQVTGAAGAVTAAAFGTVSNTYVTLTVNTTTQLLVSNSNRKYAYISNNSGGIISIQFGSSTGLTSTARGLVIPNGNYYELKGDNLYTGAIYAYTNASGLVVAVTEGTP